MFTGMLAAELLVKNAVIPLSFRQRRTSGYGFWRVQMKVMIGLITSATINMGGAAITISIMALAAAHTLGISVDFPTALILCILAAASAAGASGVAGGSLLLIPMACSLFGIPNDVAMQVVGVGFIVGVIQDSCETALNSSTDVLYTACACRIRKNK